MLLASKWKTKMSHPNPIHDIENEKPEDVWDNEKQDEFDSQYQQQVVDEMEKPEEIIIKKKIVMPPSWLQHQNVQTLAEHCYTKFDETFDVVTANNHHHYVRIKNLKPFIARWMNRAYKMGLKHQK